MKIEWGTTLSAVLGFLLAAVVVYSCFAGGPLQAVAGAVVRWIGIVVVSCGGVLAMLVVVSAVDGMDYEARGGLPAPPLEASKIAK